MCPADDDLLADGPVPDWNIQIHTFGMPILMWPLAQPGCCSVTLAAGGRVSKGASGGVMISCPE